MELLEGSAEKLLLEPFLSLAADDVLPHVVASASVDVVDAVPVVVVVVVGGGGAAVVAAVVDAEDVTTAAGAGTRWRNGS